MSKTSDYQPTKKRNQRPYWRVWQLLCNSLSLVRPQNYNSLALDHSEFLLMSVPIRSIQGMLPATQSRNSAKSTEYPIYIGPSIPQQFWSPSQNPGKHDWTVTINFNVHVAWCLTTRWGKTSWRHCLAPLSRIQTVVHAACQVWTEDGWTVWNTHCQWELEKGSRILVLPQVLIGGL